MFAIASCLRRPEIIDDHAAYALRAALLLKQGLCGRAGRHFEGVAVVLASIWEER
jgi:hypothetical protein